MITPFKAPGGAMVTVLATDGLIYTGANAVF